MDVARIVPPSRFRHKIGFVMAYAIIRSLSWTYRMRVFGLENRKKAQDLHKQNGYIFACWHEHVIIAVVLKCQNRLLALASRSFGGRLSGFILKRFGFDVAYGSQRSGGKDARISLLNSLAAGSPVAILPDASVGPRRIPKPGATYLAKKSGAPILPFFVTCKDCWRLKTWDRMMIPKPFATIDCYFREPIPVPIDADEAAFNRAQTSMANAMSGEGIVSSTTETAAIKSTV